MQSDKNGEMEENGRKMKTVQIGKIEIGAGLPKICVPMVGKTEEELPCQIEKIHESAADLVEWRIDWFEEVMNLEKLVETGKKVKQALAGLPLLVTFRTKAEGGEREASVSEYIACYQALCEAEISDLMDVEYQLGADVREKLLAIAKAHHVAVIGSNHDFHKTPSKEEIVARLFAMEQAGMDIAKIAVMPQSKRDVLTLLDATLETQERGIGVPVITMSMSQTGLISRLAGSTFGSALTFGAVGKTSAPGQIDSDTLQSILKLWES